MELNAKVTAVDAWLEMEGVVFASYILKVNQVTVRSGARCLVLAKGRVCTAARLANFSLASAQLFTCEFRKAGSYLRIGL